MTLHCLLMPYTCTRTAGGGRPPPPSAFTPLDSEQPTDADTELPAIMAADHDHHARDRASMSLPEPTTSPSPEGSQPAQSLPPTEVIHISSEDESEVQDCGADSPDEAPAQTFLHHATHQREDSQASHSAMQAIDLGQSSKQVRKQSLGKAMGTQADGSKKRKSKAPERSSKKKAHSGAKLASHHRDTALMASTSPDEQTVAGGLAKVVAELVSSRCQPAVLVSPRPHNCNPMCCAIVLNDVQSSAALVIFLPGIIDCS